MVFDVATYVLPTVCVFLLFLSYFYFVYCMHLFHSGAEDVTWHFMEAFLERKKQWLRVFNPQVFIFVARKQ